METWNSGWNTTHCSAKSEDRRGDLRNILLLPQIHSLENIYFIHSVGNASFLKPDKIRPLLISNFHFNLLRDVHTFECFPSAWTERQMN